MADRSKMVSMTTTASNKVGTIFLCEHLARGGKRTRIIERLRMFYPGKWTYDPRAFYPWTRDDGMRVRAVAKMTPKYDGDDESFVIEYRDDKGNRVVLAW